MFSFLNTLEILPVDQVQFIAKVLGESGLDAAVMLKAKVGMPGFISVNAWRADAQPLCRTIATELVCVAEWRPELRRVLEEFCEELRAGAKGSIQLPGDGRSATGAWDKVRMSGSRLPEPTGDGAS